MKFLLIVLALAAVYFICTKRNLNRPQPAASPITTQLASPAAPAQNNPSGSSNHFKRPLDRTHEVLDQARKSKESNGF